MKKSYVVMVLYMLFVFAVPSFAETTLYNQVEREVSAAQFARSARVDLTFEYKKDFWLSDYVHRRRPGFRNVIVKTEMKQKKCVGVLLKDSRVATLSECAKYKDFELVEVRVSLSNGQTGSGKAGAVSVNDDIAYVRVSSSLTKGLGGLEVTYIPQGNTLQDVYGSDFGTKLQSFLAGRGVVTRKARLMGHRPQLEKGEPFIWKGKVVALFNSVPSHLPVSLFGQISEDYLSVFRA